MPSPKRFTEKLIVLLTPAQKNKLEKTAKKQTVSIASLVRQAVESYFKNNK